MSNRVKLSIIIVYFEGIQNLLKLLKSIKKNKPKFKYEIIIVNNSSEENIKFEVKSFNRQIVYIKSPGNIGYARGNNLGVKKANGEYVFIINPDTEVKDHALNLMIKFLESRGVAAVGPSFLYSNGEPISYQGTKVLTPLRAIFTMSFFNKIFPENPIAIDYFNKNYSKDVPRPAEVLSGTAFIVRKNIFKALGGFDEELFLYFEEADFFKRLGEKDYVSYFLPEAVVSHDWKEGDGGSALRKHFAESRFYYFKKHFGVFAAIIVELAVNLSKWHLFIIFLLFLGILFSL